MALFEICERCGKHGRIVLDSGQIGPEFAFVRHGIALIQIGIELSIFTPTEGRLLESEIIYSTLPQTWESQDLGVLWLANEHASLQADGIATEADRHTYLHQPIDKSIIPNYFVEELRRRYSTQ